MSLAELNQQLENHEISTSHIWTMWLWQSEAEEPLQPNILLNKNHLLGLLLCRAAADSPEHTPAPTEKNRMTLTPKPPSEMSISELRDTMDNILVEWPTYMENISAGGAKAEEEPDINSVIALIDSCFRHLGTLCSNPASPEIMNDSSSVEPHASGLLKLTIPCIRRMLGAFFVLYRHIHLAAVAQPVTTTPKSIDITKYHVEASMDEFHALCMHMLLPVAARLNYKHDFHGLYNHVSQVMYFHHSRYERQPRIPLEKFSDGDPMHVLPALMQLYPEIKICYEEDNMDITTTKDHWEWIVLPKRIYLADREGNVFHDTNILRLAQHYIDNKGDTGLPNAKRQKTMKM